MVEALDGKEDGTKEVEQTQTKSGWQDTSITFADNFAVTAATDSSKKWTVSLVTDKTSGNVTGTQAIPE